VPDRPFVYFPLHVTDDFKIRRVIPHCSDQAYLITRVAESLPQGYDVVLKEHPVSIGRNPLSMLRRLTDLPNVHLVDPFTSSHELIERSAAVTVIGSTVGLEALLHTKPVLTLGRPFYAGYGVTVDVESFREIREAVPAVLEFSPDRERVLQFLHAAMRSTLPGAPAGGDQSDENVGKLAGALEAAARRLVAAPAPPVAR
jgi:capsule polysaccharide export protein KpsC/LpsZ